MADQAQFVALMEKHQADVWRYLRYLGCETALAEDLTQETFLALYEKPFEARSIEATAAWLRTVARNLFLNAMRRQSRVPVQGWLDEADNTWVAMTSGGTSDARLEALDACLAALEAESGELIKLRYGDELAPGEIAKRLGKTVDSVKSLLKRTKARLHRCLKEKGVGSHEHA